MKTGGGFWTWLTRCSTSGSGVGDTGVLKSLHVFYPGIPPFFFLDTPKVNQNTAV